MNNGKKFELKALELHKRMCPHAKIEYNYKTVGKNSKIKRQIDFAIFEKVGITNIFIAVECKDLTRPVEIKDIEAFVTVLNDIGAHKGIVISSNGFTEGAINTAKRFDIDLHRLFDEEATSIDLIIPCSIEYKRVTTYTFSIRSRDKEFRFKTIDNINNILIYDTNKKPVELLGTLVKRKFDAFSHTVKLGSHKLYLNNITLCFDGEFIPVDGFIEYEIQGYLEDKKIKLSMLNGFVNEITGEVNASEMISEPIELLTGENLKKMEFSNIVPEGKGLPLSVYIEPLITYL